MNISVDYDNTYTSDPSFWYSFIVDALAKGYNPMIVTYRDERYDMTEALSFLIEDDIPVYFTRGVAKKWWMHQFAKEEHKDIHIWIDDKPHTILNNSELDNNGLKEWRNEQGA
jgi:hypothetical protein